ncbi:MAG TPA: hypothetical protein VL358_04165 [Caulobacteraceae bacterium]|jgi:hypothetical protein|nr:hypothetical protein [Caulobacteraceae bacterium]
MHRNDLIPTGAIAVTPSDTTQLGLVGVYVGAAGDLAVVGGDGGAVTFPSVPAGVIIPMAITKVKTTGTTASGIVGFVA